MGMPACTITSATEHGGMVVLGFPMVLIGFLPASRITDMHVCPMVNGVVPHVGGPFVMGSPTVLVGMMPQSRVTDQLVCVGPPDAAVMGCVTVLVGEAGGGGAAGAAAGIQAMGAEVPTESPSSSSSSQESSELQSDGTVKTSAPPGSGLPPAAVQSPGHPDLPASQAPNFQSVQPVTLPPNTTLYSVTDSSAAGPGSLWSPVPPPPDPEAFRQGAAVKPESNDLGQVVTATVPEDGVKAWLGEASSRGPYPGGALQVYVPPGTLPVKKKSTAVKGIFGEYCADLFMANLGFNKMNGEPTKLDDKPKGPGIDGVYSNPNPPPSFVVADAKYGSSTLGNTKSGKQMSPKWINDRLNKAVGSRKADEIRLAMRSGDVRRIVLNVDENGKVTPTIFGPGEPK